MSLKKHVPLIFLSSIFQSFINFVSGVLLTRILGAEGRGVLFKIDGSVNLLGFFVTLKTPFSVTFFSAKKDISIEKILGLSIVIIFLSVIVTFLLYELFNFIGGSHLLLPIHYQGLFFVIYLLALLFFTQAELFTSAFLRGGKFFEKVFQLQITSSLTRLTILGIAFLATITYGINISLKNGLLLHLMVVILFFIISGYFFLKTHKVKPDFNLKYGTEVKPFFLYSITTSLALFMNFLNKSADIWFVDYYSGTVQLGLYAVAVNLSSLMILVPGTLREILMPYIAGGDKETNVRHLAILSRFNFTLLCVVSVVLYFLSSYIIPLLYGSEFQTSVLPFQILLAGILVNGSGILFSAYNYGTSMPKLNLYSNFVGVLITIALDFALIPRYGIIGAAIASSVAYSVSAILIFASVIFVQKLPFQNYFIIEAQDFRSMREYLKEKLNRHDPR